MNRYARVAAALALGGLTACGTGVTPAAQGAQGALGGLGGDWTLVRATVDGAPLTLVSTAPVTMTVDGAEVSGRSACNAYSGAVQADGDGVAFTGLGGTDMGCEADVMALENAFHRAMTRVRTAEASGDALTLTGDGVELAFEPTPAVEDRSLVGTQWVLETLVAGAGADAAASPAGRPSVLLLSADGRLEADGGCNRLGGTWRRAGDTIETADLATTLIGCEGDVALQEAQVLDVLTGPFTAVVEAELLTVTIQDGRALVYRAAP